MGEEGGGHRQAVSVTTIGPPAADTSLLDLMRQTVSRKGNDVFATWYDSQGRATNEHTFEGIWEEAGLISHCLRNKWKLKKGDRVVLCYNFGLHFFASFLGCLRAGVIAVLVHPPGPPLSQSIPKMNKVTIDCDAKLILIDSVIALEKKMDKWNPLSKTGKEWPDDSKFKVTDKLFLRLHGETSLEFDDVTSPDDTAFLQYTSGSTGDPKGVMVTFCALQANVRLLQNSYCNGMAMAEDGAAPNEPSGFSWLPQYHDLGLVHGTIAPFVGGWRMHMMSPVDFVRKPLLWLDLMSQHRVDWGVAPDFGYSLVARKFVEAKEQRDEFDPIPGLNLSCLRYLQSGAEPVRATTVETFGNLFNEYGLRQNWFVGSYGLAEHVVGVCFVHGYHLSVPRDEDNFPRVACGSRHTFERDLVVKIVNDETLKEVKDGETGEVWISGPSVAAGYFGKPKLSEEVFRAKIAGSRQTFLRTGDLAFFQDDYLYVCGRIKDLIIINGVNYYPQDIESTVQEASPAVRPGCVAAFSSSDLGNDLEIVFEIRKASQRDAADIIKTARCCVMERIGLLPSRVVAIKERSIPKTTSGKIRRRATRSSLQDGVLNVVFDWTKPKEIIKEKCSTEFVGALHVNEEEKVHTTTQKVSHNGNLTNSAERLPSEVRIESNQDFCEEKEQPAIDTAIPEELPTTSFPQVALDAVRAIQVDLEKLESCFKAMRLDKIPQVAEAWASADKSTSALQNLCDCSIKNILGGNPTVVQFVHLLAKNPHWIIADDMQEELIEIVHVAFVLEWATLALASDSSLLQEKFEMDRASEEELTSDLVPREVPTNDATNFFLSGKTNDPLYGHIPVFMWMKIRSVEAAAIYFIEISKNRTEAEVKRVQELMLINVLEASWADHRRGLYENASVAQWLAARTELTTDIDKAGCYRVFFEQHSWEKAHVTWNLAFCASLECLPQWFFAKLFLPCVIGGMPGTFLQHRVVSLYLVATMAKTSWIAEDVAPPLLSVESIRAFGILNKRWAFDLAFDSNIDWSDPLTQTAADTTTNMFRCFDDLDKHAFSLALLSGDNGVTAGRTSALSQLKNGGHSSPEMVDLVRRTVASVLGVPPDEIPLNRPLYELGLTSILVIQLAEALSSAKGENVPSSVFYGAGDKTLEAIACQLGTMDSALTNLSFHIPNVMELRQSPRFLKRLDLSSAEEHTQSIPGFDNDGGQVHPLTRVQQRMLLAQNMDPDIGVYNVPVIVKLREEVSIPQVEAAFRALMRLHPVLCTRCVGDPTLSEPSIGLVDLQLADDFSIVILDEEPVTESRLGLVVQEPFNLQTEASVRVFYVPGACDLLMVFHHIVIDGGSMPVLIHHLSELYKDSSWTPNKNGTWDYIDIAWREFERESKGIQYDVSFWTNHLGLDGEGNILPVLELPDDPERNRNATFTQAVKASVDLTSSSSHNAVAELSRLHKVTPFVVHMCVFEIVVKCFTGHDDLVLGVTVNLRPGTHSQALGMFVNTVALRLRNSNIDSAKELQCDSTSEEDLFINLMQRRASLWKSALERADVPFDMVASQAHGHNGVFQAVFNYMNDLDMDNALENMPSSLSVITPGTTVQSGSLSKFDLEFTVSKSGLSASARKQIWSQSMLQRFLDCCVELLKSVTSNPTLDVPCRKLNLLPQSQISLLNSALIGRHKEWEHQLLMHQFFEKEVNDNPNNVALRMMDKPMTYQQVEDRANQFARCLLEDCGVELEDRVGILLPRGFEQIIALLSILKAGCAYVPLDDTYPEFRIAAIIEDSRMVACITTEKNGLSQYVRDCMVLTIENPRLDEKSTRSPSEIVISPNNLCYVLYTSGSTGVPKGVEVEHRSVCNLGLHLLHFYPKFEHPAENFLLSSRLSWDISVADIVFTLGSGGCLCLVPPDLSDSLTLNIDKLVSAMDITRLHIPPTLLQYIDVENQKSLKEIMVGGDIAMPKAIQQVLKYKVNVTNGYGPTEATVTTTQHVVTESDPCFLVGRSVSIGRPITNVRLYVLDKCMDQVPVGVLGELYICGASLARGYTNEEETRAAFVDNPFSEQCALELPNGVDTSRLYRTGDFVRVLGNGLLDFVGRVKSGSSYITLRGYRIEPREISVVLESHEFVDRAVVMVDEPRQQLVAFVASSKLLGEAELMNLCCSKLVDYAVPSKIVMLDGMPLDANGKIDRKALVASIPQSFVGLEIVEPGNEVEEILVTTFAQVLGLSEEPVSVTADIFHAYGANSLTVAQFISETRKIGCVGNLSVRDVYESSSLRKLATRIVEKSKSVNEEQQQSQETGNFVKGEASRFVNAITDNSEHGRIFFDFVKILVFFTVAALVSACTIPGIAIIMKFDEDIFLPAIIAGITSFIPTIFLLTWTLKRIEAACIERIEMVPSGTFAFFLWCVSDRLWFLTAHVWIRLFGGTLWLSWFYRWFGADVGRQVFIEDAFIRTPCLVSIGDRTVVQSGAELETLRFKEDDSILFGRNDIEYGSTIGVRAALEIGCFIGANSVVGALTCVPMGRKLAANSNLTGTSYTERDVERGDVVSNENCDFKLNSRCWHMFAPVLIHLPNIVFFGCQTALYLYLVHILNENRISAVAIVIVLEPVSSIPIRLLASLAALACRRALLFRSAPTGDEDLYSAHFYHKWIAAKLYAECVRGVSGTIVSRILTCLFGGKVDVACIVSTKLGTEPTDPKLAEIGRNVFFANNVKLRNVNFLPGGKVRFGKIVIGDDAVVMDKCVVEPGAYIGANTTIGALTVAPENLHLVEESILIGNPPFCQTGFHRNSGYWRSYFFGAADYLLGRCYTNLFIRTPLFFTLLGPIIVFTMIIPSSWDFGVGVAVSVGIGILLQPCAVGFLLFCALMAKRLLIGDFSKFVKQDENLREANFKVFVFHMATLMVLFPAFVALSWVDDFGLTRWFWRAMGAKMGKRVMIDPMALVFEADMLAIGDDSRVDKLCTLFCHTFRNGKLELEPVSIGSKSSIGALSVVLPGSTIGDETELLPLTHVMPGEHLTSGVWQGSPAERRM